MAVPPTSSARLLVVMFTDLVNSSVLKDKLGPEQYRKLKARHDGFIRQALAIAPSGAALQDTGDGYFLSFGSVAHAIQMALLFQWLMAKEPWPHPFATRVGLHLGEVEEGHSEVTGRADFVSSAIDMASRTMSLGLGGQILLTRSVYEAARQVVRQHPCVLAEKAAPELVWKAHGAYRFKGCPDPIDVFEVGARDVAPLQSPPDSEKATREKTGPAGGKSDANSGVYDEENAAVVLARLARRPITRRRALHYAALGVPAIVAGAGVLYWLRRPSPLAEIQRLEIERQVASLKAIQPNAGKAAPTDVRQVDQIQVGDNSAFDVLSDNRVADMRLWREVPLEKLSTPNSFVSVTRRLQLKKNATAKQFDVEGRTSGLEVVLSCEEAFPVTYEALRGEAFVSLDRMKVRKLSIDVSAVEVGKEFTLHLVSNYLNSMQTESEQWIGFMGYKKSFLGSLLLVFPENKPFKTYKLMRALTAKTAPVAFNGSRIVFQGKARDWLYWEIPDPQPGNVYRIHWTW